MKTVALVPIKLNSVRLSNKNILPLAGKPLCWHMINTLLKVKAIDTVYVYCSDDAVKQYIPENAVYLQRDKKLDGNLVKGFDIYRSFIDKIDADIYVLAHTTSPFTTPGTVQNALNEIIGGNHDSAFSAKKVQTFAWYKGTPVNYDLKDVPRTQDIEPVYVETSAFYMFKKEIFTRHNRRIGFNPYIQIVDDMEAVDIDEKADYEFAKALCEIKSDASHQ